MSLWQFSASWVDRSHGPFRRMSLLPGPRASHFRDLGRVQAFASERLSEFAAACEPHGRICCRAAGPMISPLQSRARRPVSRIDGLSEVRPREGTQLSTCGVSFGAMEFVGWWTLLRDWFRRMVRRARPRDWFEELFSHADSEEWIHSSREPVLPAMAAQSLARQLNALTPWHVRVDVDSRVQGTAVRCRSRLGFGVSAQGSGANGREDAVLLHFLNVLHGVQSFMVERSKRSWPKTDRLSRQERQADWEAWIRRLPLPDGAVEGEVARLWFGDRDHPALELDPIRLR
jgi:hypothetical protein